MFAISRLNPSIFPFVPYAFATNPTHKNIAAMWSFRNGKHQTVYVLQGIATGYNNFKVISVDQPIDRVTVIIIAIVGTP